MEHKKSYIGIKASVDNSVVELFFTDYIFDGFDWETWDTTNLVQDTIDKIKAAKPTTIVVTINSLGGDVMIGLAIYNFLKAYDANVEVQIIGFCASIASVMAMSASKGKLKMAKNSFMIIHQASSGAYGNAVEMRKQADVLETISGQLAEIYAQRAGKEATYFTDLWADGGDVWLTGKEAKKMGLVDELTNAAPVEARVDLAAFGLKNIPTNVYSQITNNLIINNMAFPKIIAAAKAESLTVAEGGFLLEEAQLNSIEAELTAAENVSAELATANGAIETANASIASMQTEISSLKETETASQATITAKDAKIAELEAKVAELVKKPSGTGTALVTTTDPATGEEEVPVYAADDTAINAWADQQLKYR